MDRKGVRVREREGEREDWEAAVGCRGGSELKIRGDNKRSERSAARI